MKNSRIIRETSFHYFLLSFLPRCLCTSYLSFDILRHRKISEPIVESLYEYACYKKHFEILLAS